MDSSSPDVAGVPIGAGAERAPRERATGRAAKMVRALLLNALMCALVALALWQLVPAIGRHGFRDTLVHSESIGTLICLLGFGLRPLLGVEHWDRPLLFAIAVPIIIALGYYGGTMIAYGLLGVDDPIGTTFHAGDTQLAALIVSFIVGTIGTYFFVAQQRISRLALAAAEDARAAQEARRRTSEAQLSMLRAQVEPHMLFNTLANIRAMVGTDPQGAQSMLDRLIDFLRTTLAGSRQPMSSLAVEFKMLGDYLALMQMRLGPRLVYSIHLPPALADRPIPALLLQPLVENAIVHGIEPAVAGGRVEVRATSIDARTMQLCVSDTGVGMTPLAESMTADSQRGFGLAQLRDRLRSAHGERASLAIESPPAGSASGTRICITMATD